MPGGFGSFVSFEFKGALASFWKGGWKAAAVAAPVLFAVLAYLVSRPSPSPSEASAGVKDLWLGMLVLSLAYAAAVGAGVGILNVFIRWFGGWTFLPLVLVPFSVFVVFLIAKGWLAGEAGEVVEALKASYASHDLTAMPEGLRVAHAGGPAALILLVIFLPFLLINALSVLFEPAVVGQLLDFFLKTGLVAALGAAPSGLFSALILAGVFVKRIKRRYGEHAGAPAVS